MNKKIDLLFDIYIHNDMQNRYQYVSTEQYNEGFEQNIKDEYDELQS